MVWLRAYVVVVVILVVFIVDIFNHGDGLLIEIGGFHGGAHPGIIELMERGKDVFILK